MKPTFKQLVKEKLIKKGYPKGKILDYLVKQIAVRDGNLPLLLDVYMKPKYNETCELLGIHFQNIDVFKEFGLAWGWNDAFKCFNHPPNIMFIHSHALKHDELKSLLMQKFDLKTVEDIKIKKL